MTPLSDKAIALLPCPWCGETPTPETEVGSTFRWRRVAGCCTPGPEVRHNRDLTHQENHEAAIAAWNRRAPAREDAASHGEDEARVEAAARAIAAANNHLNNAQSDNLWPLLHPDAQADYLRMARAALAKGDA